MDRKKADELRAEKEMIEHVATGGSPRWLERLAKRPDEETEKYMQALLALDPRTFERWKLLTMILSDERHHSR
jgi:hypothetical protein